jgi:phospholipid transport system substrate-binding protein
MTQAMAVWLLVVAATAPAATPREVVQAATSRVLAAVEGTRADRAASEPAGGAPAEARPALRRVVADLFDVDEMARRTLWRHWAGRSPEDRAEFAPLFADLLARAYLGRVAPRAGDKVVYLADTVDDDHAIVRARVLEGPRPVALDYRLHLRDGRWKVYDVLVDGVSWVATLRTQFDRVISTSSWTELLQRLRKKEPEFRTTRATGP